MENNPNIGDLLSKLMGNVSSQQTEWYKSYQYPETVIFDPDNLIGFARSALFAHALASPDIQVYETVTEYISPDLLKEIGARKVYSKIDSEEMSFYVFNDGAIMHQDRFRIVTTNETIINLVNKK